MPSADPAFRAREDKLARAIHRELTALTADRSTVELSDVWTTVVAWSGIPVEGHGLGDDFLGTLVYRWPGTIEDSGGGLPPSPLRHDQVLWSIELSREARGDNERVLRTLLFVDACTLWFADGPAWRSFESDWRYIDADDLTPKFDDSVPREADLRKAARQRSYMNAALQSHFVAVSWRAWPEEEWVSRLGAQGEAYVER